MLTQGNAAKIDKAFKRQLEKDQKARNYDVTGSRDARYQHISDAEGADDYILFHVHLQQ